MPKQFPLETTFGTKVNWRNQLARKLAVTHGRKRRIKLPDFEVKDARTFTVDDVEGAANLSDSITISRAISFSLFLT